MVDNNDDDVPLLDGDNDYDEQLITPEDVQPNVEAVFVVTFDVKYGKILKKETFFLCLFHDFFKGNIIEFQMPEKDQMSLIGVEYKAIPSGSHHINQDFV